MEFSAKGKLTYQQTRVLVIIVKIGAFSLVKNSLICDNWVNDQDLYLKFDFQNNTYFFQRIKKLRNAKEEPDKTNISK